MVWVKSLMKKWTRLPARVGSVCLRGVFRSWVVKKWNLKKKFCKLKWAKNLKLSKHVSNVVLFNFGGCQKLRLIEMNILIYGYGYLTWSIWSGSPNEQIHPGGWCGCIIGILWVGSAELIQLKITSPNEILALVQGVLSADCVCMKQWKTSMSCPSAKFRHWYRGAFRR